MARKIRSWVLNSVSIDETSPGRWSIYVEHYSASVLIGKLIQTKNGLDFQDLAGRLQLRYSNIEEYESSDNLTRFIASAPRWFIFGWKSRMHRLRRWRKDRAKREQAKRQIRQRFEAAFKGPRWNRYPSDYAELSDDRIRRGRKSSVRRLRGFLGLPKKI